MAEIGGFLRRQNRAQLLLDLCRVLPAGKAQQVADADAVRVADDRAGRPINIAQQLLRLPGVGRKTANLLLGDIYGTPGRRRSCSIVPGTFPPYSSRSIRQASTISSALCL